MNRRIFTVIARVWQRGNWQHVKLQKTLNVPDAPNSVFDEIDIVIDILIENYGINAVMNERVCMVDWYSEGIEEFDPSI